MSALHPVIVLAFADAAAAAVRLRLRDEQRAIEDALESVPPEQVRIVSYATRGDLFDALDRDNDRIVALHFAGHADTNGLQVEDEGGELEDLLTAGLAARLGGLPALELVMLNGCNTAVHRAPLQTACPGAALVLAEGAIADADAIAFAERLYRALASGATIAEAFERASRERQADPEFRPAADGPVRLLRSAGAHVFWGWSLFGAEHALDARLAPRLASAPRDVLGDHLDHALDRLPPADARAVQAMLKRLADASAPVPWSTLQAGFTVPDGVVAALAEPGGLLVRHDENEPAYALVTPALVRRIRARKRRIGRLRWLRVAIAVACAVLAVVGYRNCDGRPQLDRELAIEKITRRIEQGEVDIDPIVADADGRLDIDEIVALFPREPPPAVWRAVATPSTGPASDTAAHLKLALAELYAASAGTGSPASAADRFGCLLAAVQHAQALARRRVDSDLRPRAAAVRKAVVAALRHRFPPLDPVARRLLIDDMRPLPGGWFVMGSPPTEPGRRADEREHLVHVSPFALGRAVVTRAQFERFFDRRAEGFDVSPAAAPDAGPDPEHLPEAGVTWYEATAFAAWLGLRLPTEAEWEYAARHAGESCAPGAPITGLDASGDRVEPHLRPIPADASGEGFAGLRANVPVWTADGYGAYDPFIVHDPRGAVGERRVQRGGARGEPAHDAGCARRHPVAPDQRLRSPGVRLACDDCRR